MVSFRESAELEGDICDGVVLLHLKHRDPVEPTVVDGCEYGIIVVVGGGSQVSAESVDDGVGCGELAAVPGEYGILGE